MLNKICCQGTAKLNAFPKVIFFGIFCLQKIIIFVGAQFAWVRCSSLRERKTAKINPLSCWYFKPANKMKIMKLTLQPTAPIVECKHHFHFNGKWLWKFNYSSFHFGSMWMRVHVYMKFRWWWSQFLVWTLMYFIYIPECSGLV